MPSLIGAPPAARLDALGKIVAVDQDDIRAFAPARRPPPIHGARR